MAAAVGPPPHHTPPPVDRVVRFGPPGGGTGRRASQAESMDRLLELDVRTIGEIEVVLLWNRVEDVVVVHVVDWSTREAFSVEPPRDRARDAFLHPYAYPPTRSGLVVS